MISMREYSWVLKREPYTGRDMHDRDVVSIWNINLFINGLLEDLPALRSEYDNESTSL